MKQKFLTALLILNLLLFASTAWPDFGSFSGKSDYSTSRSSTRSSSSSSTTRSASSTTHSTSTTRTTSTPSRTYTPSRTTTTTRTSTAVPMAAGIAANSLRSGTATDTDDDEFTDDDMNTCMGVAFVFLIFFIYWIFIRRKAKKKQREVILNAPEMILNPIDEYLSLDPNFDGGKITNLMANLYVQMQNTWQAKNISSLRPYMTDEFYSQMDRQLDQFRKTGRTDYTENIAVLGVHIIGWKQSSGYDYITIGLNSRITSYTLDDRTGKVLSGDMNTEKFMEYEIDMCRKSGTITQPEEEGQKAATCPHCGAPLKLNASAQCEYCGSVITNVNTDWAICAMRGISQRTA